MREIAANSKVREKYANAIHTLGRSITGSYYQYNYVYISCKSYLQYGMDIGVSIDNDKIDLLHIQKFAAYREITFYT